MSGSRGDIGLDAFQRRAWSEAYAELRAAAEAGELGALDLERFALVAQLVGQDEEGSRLWERAHHAWRGDGDQAAAVRCAFWLALGFLERGEMAHAGGWLARAGRILDESALDCAERGYLRIPEGLGHLDDGDAESAYATFSEIAAIGERFGDVDLATLGRLGRGQALLRLGDTGAGLTQLDEIMVSVIASEVSPMVAGIVYCAVIEACHEVFDLRRAQEWTAALTAWCDSQPDLVPFRGRCQVYRAEIMQFHGDWAAAAEEAQEACERLAAPPSHPAVGAAYYRQGELHRVRGRLSDAAQAFGRAEEWGRRPEPGRALLRVAQGRTDAAAAAITHALNEARDDVARASLLLPAVEIFLAAGSDSAARDASEELGKLAVAFNSPSLAAAAYQARGAVSLAVGDHAEATVLVRSAVAGWQSLDAPYETAQARRLLAAAAEAAGDMETSKAQAELAVTTFEQLGAITDIARLRGVAGLEPADKHGLTPRELDVLKLVAAGMTNRAIATSLTISEKTVANHVGNILGKLGVSSRAAATAYAYQHHLL